MSTSATQPGTTTRAERSGKGLGVAAAALAVVIAAGFVFAINQGNEPTVSNAARPAGSTELARLNELAAQVNAESHPAFNIEATKMELARQNAVYPGTNPETRTSMLIDKLDEQIYVPSIVQPVETESAPLNQPEWDNRMP